MSNASWVSLLPTLEDAPPSTSEPAKGPTPDRRDGAVYVMNDDLRLAVDVALATRRPLLLRGEPGSGKSSLAPFLARNLGWRYYEKVVTARSRSTDLLWTFDAVRKLADASANDSHSGSLDDFAYIEPGVLWWAFDRTSALNRGAGEAMARPPAEPDAEMNAERSPAHAVVLIDEIDKADPDLPNGLLVPLGSGEFRVTETGTLVKQQVVPQQDDPIGQLLVVVTTNGERDLPQAFQRRCVTHRLPPPGLEQLVEIGRRHLATAGAAVTDNDVNLLAALAVKVLELRAQAVKLGRRPPSTAEYLDATHACRTLNISWQDENWETLERLVLRKDDDGAGDAL